MTSQTIDGVSRALLADLADYGESGKVPEPWMVEKLRALLDAKPAEVTGDDVLRWMDEHAAQPQGVPVAYMAKRKNPTGNARLDRPLLSLVGEDGWGPAFECVPIYAEQTAPVAVVMPERKQHVHQGLSHTDAKADGWNTCLDELKRLNAKPACCGSCPGGCVIGAKP